MWLAYTILLQFYIANRENLNFHDWLFFIPKKYATLFLLVGNPVENACNPT
jgi:hypothetical protein